MLLLLPDVSQRVRRSQLRSDPMGETWQWLGWVAAGVASVVAIRGNVRFDVNEWLRDRRTRKKENLRALRPHARFVDENGKLVLPSSYISPPGTTACQCQECGDVTHDRAGIQEALNYWAARPQELQERRAEIERQLRKLRRC